MGTVQAMPKISPWLPELPPEMRTTRLERARSENRRTHRRRVPAGYVLVQSRLHVSELDYLMSAWKAESRADLLRMALRYLLQQTQRGLVRIELPPEI